MRWNFLKPKKNKSNALKLVKEDDRDDDSNESMYGDEILMFVKKFRHVLKSKRSDSESGSSDDDVVAFTTFVQDFDKNDNECDIMLRLRMMKMKISMKNMMSCLKSQ
ncbi:unnamed protein product [Prunus brigantina]